MKARTGTQSSRPRSSGAAPPVQIPWRSGAAQGTADCARRTFLKTGTLAAAAALAARSVPNGCYHIDASGRESLLPSGD